MGIAKLVKKDAFLKTYAPHIEKISTGTLSYFATIK